MKGIFQFIFVAAVVHFATAAGGIECGICETVVKLIEKEVDQNEPQIEQALDKACDDLGFLASSCHTFVDKYLKVVLGLLEQGFPASKICGEIGLCLKVQDRIDGCALCKLAFDKGVEWCNPTACESKEELLADLKSKACGSSEVNIFLRPACRLLMSSKIDQIYPIAHEWDKSSEEKCNQLGNYCA